MTNVVTTKKNELAVFDYGSDAGSGFENQSSSDYSIPFLSVLQAMSPQVKEPSDGGVEGARQGMIYNTVTEQVYSGKDGIGFIPSLTEHMFVEWVPRDAGGGFVAVHDINSDIVKKAKASTKDFGKYKTASGNDLVETFYIYGVTYDGEDVGEMVTIAFTSTKIKAYKKFSTKIGMFQLRLADGRKVRPPLFAHRVLIKTVKEKNNKGEFYNFSFDSAEGNIASSLMAPGDPRLEAAKACREMVGSGMAKINHDSQEKPESNYSSSSDGIKDEDIPF